MSIETDLRVELARGERREHLFYAVLPYVLLAASTVITLSQPIRDTPVSIPGVLALSLATALWLSWMSLLPVQRRSGVVVGLYYAGLMAAAAGLVILAPWYGIFAFVGYISAFLLLSGGWQYLGVALTSWIMAVSYVGGWSQVTGGEWGLWVVIASVTMLLAAASFYFAQSTRWQGDRQKRALTELHEVNLKLESALEENAALHARLLVQAREAGVLDERQRIARDIHDTLAQSLAGILTQLQAAEETADESTRRRRLEVAVSLARDSLIEARRTIHAVAPSVLAESSLPEALRDVAHRWSQDARIDAELAVTGDARPLHPDVEGTLVRAAQEALTNVSKHARARRVGLTLSYMGDLVTLDVRDDGIGFAPDAPRVPSATGGFGLTGMRQRVQRLAGRLVVESEPGGGTALSASLPAIPAGGRS
ncbi:sensor histidine kinase [Microbacterium sp. RD1]|uniref:sensor histidine kinase n=1 Tax=Microbacterium sp. RD1 TaxID=3457313 RepID=UPI003FA527CB